MYKKQVAELHQKLAEEAKKTDRQIFENKKLAEKMEALVQERDVSVCICVCVRCSVQGKKIWTNCPPPHLPFPCLSLPPLPPQRLAKERDGLKETIEELKCHISTITSPDTASRPPSDLSDVELLDAVPHEFRWVTGEGGGRGVRLVWGWQVTRGEKNGCKGKRVRERKERVKV